MGREQMESLTQKKERKKLFNQHSGVIFLSLLEDVGKITRVSKNIKQVLGYTSGDLVGLSINELMPFSIRPFHN
jgi:PAS domain S-box-containing protein